MSRTATKPEAVKHGTLTARATRQSDKGWYWRITSYEGGITTSVKGQNLWATDRDTVRVHLVRLFERGAGGDVQVTSIRTVEDLLSWWMRQNARKVRRGNQGETTYQGYAGRIRVLVSMVGGRHLSQHGAWLDGLIDDIATQYKPSTGNGHLKVLKMAWNSANDNGEYPTRCPKWDRFTTDVAYTPGRADVRTVGAWLDDNAPAWVGLLYAGLQATGCRPCELVGKRGKTAAQGGVVLRNQLDASGRLYIRGKGRATRTITLPADLITRIDAFDRTLYPESAAQLLAFGKRMFHGGSFSHHMARAQAATGVRPFEPYALRRASIDAMLDAGIDIKAVAEWHGNSPAIILRHYRTTQASQRHQCEAAAASMLSDDTDDHAADGSLLVAQLAELHGLTVGQVVAAVQAAAQAAPLVVAA